tara:strand:+ start:132 stop:311 length:180 start_codon:yes stop_codon:yes gene_type:complete
LKKDSVLKTDGFDLRQEAEKLIDVWDSVLPRSEEKQNQRQVTLANLRWWFGDAMLPHAL